MNNQLLKALNNMLYQENKKIKPISKSELDVLILDTSRILDRKVVKTLKTIKSDLSINLNSEERNIIRRYLIGYPSTNNMYSKYLIKPTREDLIEAYNFIDHGIEVKKDSVMSTLISRYKLYFLNMDNEVYEKYLDYIKKIQEGKQQLIYINVNADNKLSSDDINHFINIHYNDLSNYHNMVITFEDGKNSKIDFNIISEVALYMENFLIEENFNVFQKRNKSRRIKEMNEFLSNNSNIIDDDSIKKSVDNFYEGVSYGFRFVDLFISDDTSKKTLVMQKVRLDEEPKRCPACFELTTRGNSYPKLLLKSFECQNPNCPARSKSGRGKRFDMLNAKCQIMLRRNSKYDRVNDDLYNSLRKDITNSESLNIENMIKLYTWADDNVLAVNVNTNDIYEKRIINKKKLKHSYAENDLYKNIPVYKLLKNVFSKISIDDNISKTYEEISDSAIVINDDSNKANKYKNMLNLTIGSAITSPPYYNAREYSQWGNFICYLIDMMINATSVYNSLENGSTYIYNVGDIVDYDYIYIKSHMSQRRLMLGFYSKLIFNIVGFKLINNIIWDKGEVQSKRNSTANHFSGYLKPVNVYEHNLVFHKGKFNNDAKLLKNKVVSIPPVKKINANGKNIYGHTAPFPEEIAELIIPYAQNNSYILDPFLGSGTTCIMAMHNNYKSIGFELGHKYYELAINRIDTSDLALF